METEAQTCKAGWGACMAGEDGRYTNPFNPSYDAPKGGDPKLRYAWDHGFLDAMEAEDGELPEPETAGYHED